VRAAHRFLGRTQSLLAMAQLDDVTGELDQVNVPATSHQHPNWRRRLSIALEDLGTHPRFVDVISALAAERGTSHPRRSSAPSHSPWSGAPRL
jgi:4-alpha-glucanotransferase